MYMNEVNQAGQSAQGTSLPNIQEAHKKNLCSITQQEIGSDWTEEEEQEWDSLFAQPHVQTGLNRLAEDAKQQFMLGEIEEGGFAVE